MFEVVLLGTFDVAVFILLLLVSSIWTIRVLQCMQKGLSIYLTVLFLDIRNLIPKEMLKSFSSPRDKQVAPDAIAKTDVPFETTWRKHTCMRSLYASKRPHSFPNFSSWSWITQARMWCLFFGLQKWSCQCATERSQGRQCWRSDAPCQSRKHSAQRTQKYKFDRSFEANC